jgi:hypothetical protein
MERELETCSSERLLPTMSLRPAADREPMLAALSLIPLAKG